MEKPESIFVKCDCCCSVVEMNFDDDFGDEQAQFNIAVWADHAAKLPLSKKERIRWCEHVMKTGRPWADHTIVSKQDAQRIADFINKKLTQYGKKKSARK
jgi:hypothetical protein